DDGVEDDEELSGCGDDGDELWLAVVDEPVAEGLEGGVVAGGREGAHEQGGAHLGSAAADEAPASPFARLPGEGSQTGEGSDLPGREAAQFGQFGEERSGDGLADAGHGS